MAKTPEEILKELKTATDAFEAGMAEINKERKALLDETIREMEATLIDKLRSDINARFT